MDKIKVEVDVGESEIRHIHIKYEGKIVLTIMETSDDECINLYFYPHMRADIVPPTSEALEGDCNWTHELLMSRKDLQ